MKLLTTITVAATLAVAAAGDAFAEAQPTVNGVISCLKANRASNVYVGNHKPPAYGSVGGTAPANAQGGLPFSIIFFNNAAGANSYVAANPPTSSELLDKANGGQTLVYIFKAEGEGNWGVAPTQALLSKCLASSTQTAPGGHAFSLNTTYSGSGSGTVAGPIDLSAPATLTWTKTGGHYIIILVLGQHTVVAANSSATSGTATVPAGSYSSIKVTLLSADRWTITLSGKASTPTTPSVSSVVSCLKRGGAENITTPAKPPTIGGVAAVAEVEGVAPSNPGFAVLLFNSVAQANAYAAKSPPGPGQTRVQMTEGALAYLGGQGEHYTAAELNAAETLVTTCVGPNAGSLPSTARSNPNTQSALVACLQAAKAYNITTPNTPTAYGTVMGDTPSRPGFGVFLFDNIAQANGFTSLNPPSATESLFTANGGVTLVYINTKQGSTALSAAKTLISGCIKR